jgi:hypothetical protein
MVTSAGGRLLRFFCPRPNSLAFLALPAALDSNGGMRTSLRHTAIASPGRAPAAVVPEGGLRFSLRSLFLIMLAAAVACAAMRAVVFQDQSFARLAFVIGVFFYGGIVAIPSYAFVGSLMVLTTRTTLGQRVGEVFSAAVGAAAWIGFFVATITDWPTLCVAYSTIVLAIMVWLVRENWKIELGPSPEAMLEKLREAKSQCPHRSPSAGPEK